MKKTLTLLLTGALLFSCSNELADDADIDPKDISVKKTRVQFDSQESFLNTWSNLGLMSSEELKSWINKHNISLANNEYKNHNINDLRDYFIALFDTNNELQIGDSIIWYNDGKMLLVSSKGDEAEANLNKLNPTECIVFGETHRDDSLIGQNEKITTRGTLGASGIDKTTSNQVEFKTTANTYRFKWIYELVAYRNVVGTNTIYDLVFMNKLEYHKGTWKEAGEWRIGTTSIRGGVTAEANGLGGFGNRDFSLSFGSNDRLRYNHSLLLASVSFPNGWDTFQRWSYNISGKMTQEIEGHPDSRRIAYLLF